MNKVTLILDRKHFKARSFPASLRKSLEFLHSQKLKINMLLILNKTSGWLLMAKLLPKEQD